jgi:hypothetical protein
MIQFSSVQFASQGKHLFDVFTVARPGRPVTARNFGFAAIVKSREPETPLWSLMLATVWLDLVLDVTGTAG